MSFWGISKWGEGKWKDLSGYVLTYWWNNAYQFRRRIQITPDPFKPVEVGYPITINVDYLAYLSLKKIRPDYSDIEIIRINYNYDFADEVLERVPFKVVQNPTTSELQIVFNAVERITSENNDYAIYYYNPNLTNAKPTLPFVESDHIISVTSLEHNSSLTFSRPNEDWKLGFSDVVNARVALSFYGRSARLRVEKGPDRGIFELRLDKDLPIMINTYNPVYINSVVYETANLGIADHMIRVRVTGDKSASSQSHGIQFNSFDYSFYVDNELLAEEIQIEKRTISSIIGA